MIQVRKTLERCDITHDLNMFVKQHKTGRQKPASIPYENFYKSDVKIPMAESTPTENQRGQSFILQIVIHVSP